MSFYISLYIISYAIAFLKNHPEEQNAGKQTNAGTTDMFYVYTDQIGAHRFITTNSGISATVWTCNIEPNAATRDNNDPLGANTNTNTNTNTANAISLTHNVSPFGQCFDSESGMHYNYFRDYDPVVGRYATSDPID